MTNKEKAAANFAKYLMADFGYMMGRNERPAPQDYGFSGGNTVWANGEAFHVDELIERTAPVHAGF